MALASLLPKVAATPTIKETLKLAYTKVENVAYLTSKSYTRCSGLSGLCPRQEVICAKEKLVRQRKIDGGFQVILHNGTALHYIIQNNLLADLDVILGYWRCLSCGHLHKGKGAMVESAIKRPTQCQCEGTDFLYIELDVKNEEWRLTGHCDGILQLSGQPGLGVLEIKSIAQEHAWKVSVVPMFEHLIQANAYMWLFGLQWAMIFYWNKGANGMESLIEHKIELNMELVEEFKSTLTTLWSGIETGIVPPRTVCATKDAPKALECPVRTQCFEINDDIHRPEVTVSSP